MQKRSVQAKAFFHFVSWFSHQSAHARRWATSLKIMKKVLLTFLYLSIAFSFALTACKQSVSKLGVGSMMTGKDRAILLYVPAGKFVMGNKLEDTRAECLKMMKAQSLCEPIWFNAEQPPHEVELSAFWIDQTEVTNAMYEKCVKDGVCKAPTNTSSPTHSNYYGNAMFANYPVLYANWNMAKIYCNYAGRRLPTEAEWEKAARGTDGRIYPWGSESPNSTSLNYDANIGDVTEVGKYPKGKSYYGAYDMAGNVAEWVNDWFSGTYYKNSPLVNPLGPDKGQDRVLRGGSFNASVFVRSTSRYWFDPSFTDFNFGFRCASSE